MRLVIGMVLTFTAGMAVAGEPAPPFTSPDIIELTAGVMCSPRVQARIDAPNTALGYTNEVAGNPKVTFEQQVVPAALGVSFGVVFTPKHALAAVRNLTFRPGASEPDVYFSDVLAEPGRYRGFAFELPEELVLGQWRLESWQGDTLLFRADFEVVPPEALPEIEAQCQGMS